MDIWYIFPILACCSKKNLATLIECPMTDMDLYFYAGSGTRRHGIDERTLGPLARVARWFIFKPKIPIWVKFGEL
jgi:hypothetical protein